MDSSHPATKVNHWNYRKLRRNCQSRPQSQHFLAARETRGQEMLALGTRLGNCQTLMTLFIQILNQGRIQGGYWGCNPLWKIGKYALLIKI